MHIIDNILQARSKQTFAGQVINVMHDKYVARYRMSVFLAGNNGAAHRGYSTE